MRTVVNLNKGWLFTKQAADIPQRQLPSDWEEVDLRAAKVSGFVVKMSDLWDVRPEKGKYNHIVQGAAYVSRPGKVPPEDEPQAGAAPERGRHTELQKYRAERIPCRQSFIC